MRSSETRLVLACVIALTSWTSSASAQQQANGFDLERLYTSAPGAGWLVMDSLDLQGGLGGAASAVTSYARNPLRVTDGKTRLALVSDEAFLQIGFAVTYDRYRLYASFDSPLTLRGESGVVGAYSFTAPSVDMSSSPDAISHGRVGLDTRLLGQPRGVFRVGLGAQLYLPGGAMGSLRENYLSDGPPSQSFGSYDVQGRLLFAGDVGALHYAGHVGFHLRGLDDAPIPGSPRGNEALFGLAAGGTVPLCVGCGTLVLGPELFGVTALRAPMGTDTTSLEGILSARLDEPSTDSTTVRLRVGGGGGIHAHFGAPEWRAVLGIELVGRIADPPEVGSGPAESVPAAQGRRLW